MSKKRRQHYVFQAYLRAWTQNNNLWCKRIDREPFETATINVAQERDFYRLKQMNNSEKQFIKMVLPQMSEEIEKAFFDHINQSQILFSFQTLIHKISQVFENNYDGDTPNEIKNEVSKFEKEIDNAINNAEEDFHSEIEGAAIFWIDLLKSKNSDFYYQNDENVKDEDCFDNDRFRFLFFLCVQYFRTKAIKERSLSNVKNCFNDHPRIAEKYNINVENSIHHILWYTQNSSAYNLFMKKAHLTVLVNETDIPFITSDQPVINLKANYQNLNVIPTELVFYYPIAPSIAITVNDNNVNNELLITRDQVDEYNRAIIAASFQNIFSSCDSVIERYRHLL